MEKVKAGSPVSPAPAQTAKKPEKNMGKTLKALKENHPLLIMVLPAVLVVFLFNYLSTPI